MVLRRGEADPTVLVSFRPTRRQVLGRRLRGGCAVSAGLAVLLSVPAVVGPDPLAAVWVLGVVVPVLVGFAGGLLGGRSAGVVIDDRGIGTPTGPRPAIRWDEVVDVYPERSRRRTVTVLRLGPASVVRLPAPYDGRLLAHDPGFEDKLFTLRQLWETHRRFHPR